MTDRISLNGNDWWFKEFHGADWVWRKSVAPDTRDTRWWHAGSVPGSVQHDLWTNGEIENPYFEKNSMHCEWVSQRTWVYKKTFFVEPDLAGKCVRLVFLGIDYSAQIYLNGEFLGSHEGMFTPVSFDVSDRLKLGAENLVAVVIEAAPQEQPQVGYTSRVHTHKSRMGYWWDFCPRMVHVGIWQDVYLEVSGEIRITDVFVRPNLSENYDHAVLNITIDLEARAEALVDLEFTIQFEHKDVAAMKLPRRVPMGQTKHEASIDLPRPRLWWPNGYGAQNMYEATVTVWVDGKISQQKSTHFGIRKIELLPNETAAVDALPYTLVVNGRKMYIKGWNWVPMDVLYGVPREEKLDHLLKLVQNAHVNMLRVWGGGLIEKESFYERCDRLGIMVWQEFIQSSSGIDNTPPDSEPYIQMMVREAEAIIPLKRNHPSLALWCGGNELQAGDEKPLDDTHPVLAALKEVVQRLDPGRCWLATSPTGRVFSNSLKNIRSDPSALQDVHGPWEYQGAVEQYTLYNQGASLLHSEFGVEGITNPRALNRVVAIEHQWPVSKDENPYWWHLGSWWVQREVWNRVFGNLEDVKTYIRATQFTQFDGLRYALEADRRRKYHNSGTFPWQFNEPYPMAVCTSAVDYFGQPKPVYYAVAQAYEPVHVSARFDRLIWNGQELFECEVWVSNADLVAYQNAKLTVKVVDTAGNASGSLMSLVSFEANQSSHLTNFKSDLNPLSQVFFLDICLQDETSRQLSSNRYVFTRADKLTPLLCTNPTLISAQLTVHADGWDVMVRNDGEQTALFIWLEDARDSDLEGFVTFDQNYFCLFPGEERQVRVEWRHVGETVRSIEVGGWNTNTIRLQA